MNAGSMPSLALETQSVGTGLASSVVEPALARLRSTAVPKHDCAVAEYILYLVEHDQCAAVCQQTMRRAKRSKTFFPLSGSPSSSSVATSGRVHCGHRPPECSMSSVLPVPRWAMEEHVDARFCVASA